MKNNKEQNYIYGETLSPEAPKPTKAVYEILTQHLTAKGDKIETHVALNDIYKALASDESDIGTALESLEQKSVIDRQDILILMVLLAASKTLGPNLDFLRQTILTGHSPDIDSTITDLDPVILDYLKLTLPKLTR